MFSCVEINSSFYRPHKPETYRRWAESVPESFRFSVKVPKEITHVRRLRDCQAPLDRFLSQVHQLGVKLGPLLIQIPPSERFDARVAEIFFDYFRAGFSGLLALEPRHSSWFGADAEAMLKERGVALVAADPSVVPAASETSGGSGFAYHRLHGSPKMYYSNYPARKLSDLATSLAIAAKRGDTYCIFDNTAQGHAIPNAFTLKRMINEISYLTADLVSSHAPSRQGVLG